MQIFKNPNYDFLKIAPLCLALSTVLSLVGVFALATGRLHYGIEFSQGAQIIARFQQTPKVDHVRQAIEKQSAGAVIQTYGEPKNNQLLIRIAGANLQQENLSGPVDAVLKGLAHDYSENPIVDSSSEIVGPVVGADLRKKASLLTLLGLAAQLTYIALRFRTAGAANLSVDAPARTASFFFLALVYGTVAHLALGGFFWPCCAGIGVGMLMLLPGANWGSAATFAVFHDVLITIGLLSLFGYEITLNVIAALLTLVGYSMNDTIVVFDRVRENMRQRRKDPLPKIINDSINQTLSRTVISSGTTFLTVLGLFIVGGEVLKGFAFTMVVGIVVGTYSSIYIASPLVIWWNRISGRRGEPRATRISTTAAL